MAHKEYSFVDISSLSKKEKEVWQNVFMLTSEGDEFYIVHYKKQDAIKLMYPAKTHEYKER